MSAILNFLKNPRTLIAGAVSRLSFNVNWLPTLDLNVPSVLMAAVISYFVVPVFSNAIGIPGPFWPSAFLIVLWVTMQSWLCSIVIKGLATPFSQWRGKNPVSDLFLAFYDLLGTIVVLAPVQLRIVSAIKPDLLRVDDWSGVLVAWLLLMVGELVLAIALRINAGKP